MLPPKTKNTRALRRDSEWAFPHFGAQATSHWSVRSEILYFHFGVDCFLDSKRAQLRRNSDARKPTEYVLCISSPKCYWTNAEYSVNLENNDYWQLLMKVA